MAESHPLILLEFVSFVEHSKKFLVQSFWSLVIFVIILLTHSSDFVMSRLIFGSCSSQHYSEQPLWPVIQKRNATAFVWGGDAVYGDDRTSWKGFRRKLVDASPDYLRKLFQDQRNEPGYKELLETNISIFGTVDDHDYGTNNGDRTFEWKRENAMEFVRFLGLSEESPMFRRASNGKGIYGVQVYDFDRPMGSRLLSNEEAGLDPDVVPDDDMSVDTIPMDNKLVAVFVLDIRSNRTPWRELFSGRKTSNTSMDGDFLGEDQWTWFETAMRRSRAAVNVIVTGLQVHPDRFFDPNLAENWNGFQRSQHRLYQTLLQSNVRAPILISGDVHHAQLMRKDCKKVGSGSTMLRPLYEITTSGMTHSWGTKVCGRANDNPICHSPYHNFLFRNLMHFAHSISPWTELLIDETSGELQYNLEMNVAELDFDWDLQTVSVSVLGINDQVLLRQQWSMNELTRIKDTIVDPSDFDRVEQNLRDTTIVQSDDDSWICVNYRGTPDRLRLAIGAALPFFLVLFFGTLPMWILVAFSCRSVLRRCSTATTTCTPVAKKGKKE